LLDGLDEGEDSRCARAVVATSEVTHNSNGSLILILLCFLFPMKLDASDSTHCRIEPLCNLSSVVAASMGQNPEKSGLKMARATVRP
jgi:hypothetical protein